MTRVLEALRARQRTEALDGAKLSAYCFTGATPSQAEQWFQELFDIKQHPHHSQHTVSVMLPAVLPLSAFRVRVEYASGALEEVNVFPINPLWRQNPLPDQYVERRPWS